MEVCRRIQRLVSNANSQLAAEKLSKAALSSANGARPSLKNCMSRLQEIWYIFSVGKVLMFCCTTFKASDQGTHLVGMPESKPAMMTSHYAEASDKSIWAASKIALSAPQGNKGVWQGRFLENTTEQHNQIDTFIRAVTYMPLAGICSRMSAFWRRLYLTW